MVERQKIFFALFSAIGPCLSAGESISAIGLAVAVQNLVKPDRRLLQHVWLLPGIPGQVRLRLADHEAPVDGAYMAAFGDRQNRVKGAAGPSLPLLGSFQTSQTRMRGSLAKVPTTPSI